jgi:hypothetical protein
MSNEAQSSNVKPPGARFCSVGACPQWIRAEDSPKALLSLVPAFFFFGIWILDFSWHLDFDISSFFQLFYERTDKIVAKRILKKITWLADNLKKGQVKKMEMDGFLLFFEKGIKYAQ